MEIDMFSSLAVPAILLTGQKRRAEEAYISMTAKKSTDATGIDMSSHSDDAQALTILYERYRRQIHAYIYRLLGNQEDADDITQEVFIRACVAWDGLQDRDNLSAWLYRIATNLCVDLLRRRKRISWWSLTHRNYNDRHSEEIMADDSSHLLPDSGGIPEIAEREHIQLALANMPEEYTVALVLSAAQGIPYQEVAAIVGISPNAAATRISRAKRMFAEQYQRISKEGVAIPPISPISPYTGHTEKGERKR